MNAILRLFSLYELKHKLNLIKLILFVSISSFIQFFFLSSIVLVISVLVDPNLLLDNKYFFYLFNSLNFSNKDYFTSFIIFCSLFFVILSSLFNLLNNYLISKYSNFLAMKLENIFFSFYIYSDYSFFIKNSQSRLISKLKDNIQLIAIRLFPNIFVFFSAIATLTSIILILLFIDYQITLFIFATLLFFYYFFYYFLKSKIGYLSESNNKLFYVKTKFIVDILKNLKVLKFFPKNNFNEIHYANSKLLSQGSVKLFVIETSPRVFMEFILYAGSLLLIFYFYKIDNQYLNVSKIVFFGLASSKALPSFNQIFTAIVNIKSSLAYINVFSEEISSILEVKKRKIQDISKHENKNITFNKKIFLSKVSFSFFGNNKFNISDLDIVINKNTFVAVCGKSGSGKTTIVDLISGVYRPINGSLFIDDIEIKNLNLDNYTSLISYVPQEFFIGEGTIREAITFGHKDDENPDSIDFALKFSGVMEFIDNLPNKIDTQISDRGINLSLGQKQRISIARALYKRPEILILDESTNSLDLITEKKILNDLKTLSSMMTIIFISHRISSLNICDYLYLIKDGKVADKGTFDYLSRHSEHFNALLNG
jgi:ATP-binding cassette, subfamily B, bacterial PglK